VVLPKGIIFERGVAVRYDVRSSFSSTWLGVSREARPGEVVR
jgi:hypothetical protein